MAYDAAGGSMKVEDILKECRDELRRLGIRGGVADPYDVFVEQRYYTRQIRCRGNTYWFQLPKSVGGAIIGWWNQKTMEGEFVPQGLRLHFDKKGCVVVTYQVVRKKK